MLVDWLRERNATAVPRSTRPGARCGRRQMVPLDAPIAGARNGDFPADDRRMSSRDRRVQAEKFDIAADRRACAPPGGARSRISPGSCAAAAGCASSSSSIIPARPRRRWRQLRATRRRAGRCSRVTIVHRVGAISPGEPIVFVGASAMHRCGGARGVRVSRSTGSRPLHPSGSANTWRGVTWVSERMASRWRRSR